MEITDPKLENFIKNLNKEIIDQINDNKDYFTEQLEELKYIQGINGDRRLVKDIVRATHNEIKSITKFLSRPRIIIAVVFFILSQVFIFGIWKGTVDQKFEGVEKIMIRIEKDAHTNQEDIKELLRDSK